MRLEARFNDHNINDGRPFLVIFAWRRFLEKHLERYGAVLVDHMSKAFLELFPPPARNFCGNPPLYLVIEVQDGCSALLKPNSPPLFADSTGLIVGRGSRPASHETMVAPTFASKPSTGEGQHRPCMDGGRGKPNSQLRHAGPMRTRMGAVHAWTCQFVGRNTGQPHMAVALPLVRLQPRAYQTRVDEAEAATG